MVLDAESSLRIKRPSQFPITNFHTNQQFDCSILMSTLKFNLIQKVNIKITTI